VQAGAGKNIQIKTQWEEGPYLNQHVRLD